MFLSKEKTGVELRKEAVKNGLSSEGWYTNDGIFREAAVQERLRSAKIARYARWSWIIAFISALASLTSAAAAWIAIQK